jgi:hypothetical protein
MQLTVFIPQGKVGKSTLCLYSFTSTSSGRETDKSVNILTLQSGDDNAISGSTFVTRLTGVGVRFAADSQSTSSSWYRAPLRAPWPHYVFLFFFLFDNYFVVLPRAPSLTRGRVCSLQCNRWLSRSLTTNNHTLPSHLRLCSLFVASYDSQGLRWRYSNPPTHGVPDWLILNFSCSLCRTKIKSYGYATKSIRVCCPSAHASPYALYCWNIVPLSTVIRTEW